MTTHMEQSIPARPPFDSLPLRQGDPPFSAWGLYGDNDQLGTLNLLTPQNTLAAAQSEIRTGVRVSLDPPIDYLKYPLGGRKALVQTVIRRGSERPVHDDEVTFNTQVGAQWDGFRHLTYLELKQFYNGTSLDRISGPLPDPSAPLGIHSKQLCPFPIAHRPHGILASGGCRCIKQDLAHTDGTGWVENGAIAGRGALLDYYSWAQANNKSYALIGEQADYAITLQELQECARSQGTEIRHGDLLFVRSGFFVGYNSIDDKAKQAWPTQDPPRWVGVEANRAMAKWLWDSGISACAGDAPGWERILNHDLGPGNGLEGLSLHQIMLGGWAMPIGEMFDLERLSEECKRQGRWSFFVTSAPLHVRGGVASPPNCIAIF